MNQSQDFIKIFTGNTLDVLALRNALEEKSIVAVIKDDSESARLAGFGMVAPGLQEVFVHEDELDQAVRIVESLK
jgi:predicted ABC-class ATPase